MEFEYTVELFPVETTMPQASAGAENVVYACGGTGECTVRDLRLEHLQALQDSLNGMGRDGWELVQLFFYRTGVVTFWKRVRKERDVSGKENE